VSYIWLSISLEFLILEVGQFVPSHHALGKIFRLEFRYLCILVPNFALVKLKWSCPNKTTGPLTETVFFSFSETNGCTVPCRVGKWGWIFYQL